MKKPKDCSSFFFVDEAGDSTFYDRRGRYIVGKEGCSEFLVLGFIETQNPEAIRDTINALRLDIVNDPYFRHVPSMKKTAKAFHAKDDLPEVRLQVFRTLRTLDFKTQFVVARKIEEIFQCNHHGEQNKFFDNLVTKLFKNVLHRYQDNSVIFSRRGSRPRKRPLERALWRAKGKFSGLHNVDIDSTTFTVRPMTPIGEPCLSVADYMVWAVYQAFSRGQFRFCEYVNEKISYMRDVYDFGNGLYTKKNPFTMEQAARLGLGSS